MGLVSILFPLQKTEISDRFGLDVVIFDATLTESYKTQVVVTEHPVESGSQIADHMQPKPLELEIVGIISNTPLPYITTNVQTLRSFFNPTRAEDYYDILLSLQKSGELVTVTASIQEVPFENMAITSVQLDRDVSTANIVKCHLSLKQVRVSKSLGLDLKKTVARNAKKKKLGAKSATKTATKTVTKTTSLAKRLAKRLAKLFGTR